MTRKISKKDRDKFKEAWCRDSGMPQCLFSDKIVDAAIRARRKR